MGILRWTAVARLDPLADASFCAQLALAWRRVMVRRFGSPVEQASCLLCHCNPRTSRALVRSTETDLFAIGGKRRMATLTKEKKASKTQLKLQPLGDRVVVR